MSKVIEEHGWSAVPRSIEKVVSSRKSPKPPKPVTPDDFPLPHTPLTQTVTMYAKEHLPKETFQHSMRVYYYGETYPPLHELSQLASMEELHKVYI